MVTSRVLPVNEIESTGFSFDRGILFCNAGKLCLEMLYGSKLFEKTLTNNSFFSNEKHGKHDDHSMIMVRIMENMVVIP